MDSLLIKKKSVTKMCPEEPSIKKMINEKHRKKNKIHSKNLERIMHMSESKWVTIGEEINSS